MINQRKNSPQTLKILYKSRKGYAPAGRFYSKIPFKKSAFGLHADIGAACRSSEAKNFKMASE